MHIVKKQVDMTAHWMPYSSHQISNVRFPATAISLKIPTARVVQDPTNPGFFQLDIWPGPRPRRSRLVQTSEFVCVG